MRSTAGRWGRVEVRSPGGRPARLDVDEPFDERPTRSGAVAPPDGRPPGTRSGRAARRDRVASSRALWLGPRVVRSTPRTPAASRSRSPRTSPLPACGAPLLPARPHTARRTTARWPVRVHRTGTPNRPALRIGTARSARRPASISSTGAAAPRPPVGPSAGWCWCRALMSGVAVGGRAAGYRPTWATAGTWPGGSGGTGRRRRGDGVGRRGSWLLLEVEQLDALGEVVLDRR